MSGLDKTDNRLSIAWLTGDWLPGAWLPGCPVTGPVDLFVLRFYGPVNPMGSCLSRSVYLTTHLLGRLSPLSG